MGTFRVQVELESPVHSGRRVTLRDVLVDTGAALSWFPAASLDQLDVTPNKPWYFRQADGSVLERMTGFVIVGAAGTSTIDEVVIGQPGDLVLLGARSLEGLNLRVEPATKRLVDAGPAPAAVAA